MADRPGRSTLEQVLAHLGRRTTGVVDAVPAARLSAAAFRASIDERLRSLERQLDEVKGRVNGLLFLLAGAVATQVVLRLLEWRP
jgi:hypothetical protein